MELPLLPTFAAAAFAGLLGCNTIEAVAIDAGQEGGDAARPGDGGVACRAGSITFALNAAAGGATSYCLGTPGTCSSEWLVIRAADGGALSIDAPCLTTCAQCQPIACSNLCAIPSPLGDGGTTRSWDGTTFPSSTCGGSLSCYDTSCAPAGSYVATMCGYVNTAPDASLPGCTSGQTPTCTDVPFDWPPPSGTATVTGTIGGDGG